MAATFHPRRARTEGSRGKQGLGRGAGEETPREVSSDAGGTSQRRLSARKSDFLGGDAAAEHKGATTIPFHVYRSQKQAKLIQGAGNQKSGDLRADRRAVPCKGV